ncbi:hypothetical protein [Streptomyces sp. CC219B]|uniref:hypothetical protein n=1 Tax=Streptomyces sp. CC219B TaxID=3044574 RepID=UPI0024A98F9C|nr:hypothetical protein [Streptomyces sp. CC219B]
MLVLKEAAQVHDESAGPADTMAGCDMSDEVVQPGGWVGQLVAKVFAADEGAAGVFLPAGRAQPQAGMTSQLSALAAVPRRLLLLSGP